MKDAAYNTIIFSLIKPTQTPWLEFINRSRNKIHILILIYFHHSTEKNVLISIRRLILLSRVETCLVFLSDNSPCCVAVGYLNLGDNNYEDNLVGYHITKSS